MRFSLSCATSLLALQVLAGTALAAGDPSLLKTTLTPLGGERAGNAAGTIPAWSPMQAGPPLANPHIVPDRYAADRKVLSIDASNVDKYAQQLSAGLVYMLKNYPKFRIDVYPTHRDAAAPQWVYDATAKNVTTASLQNHLPVNAINGIPFPIPQSAEEIVWNGNNAWRGVTERATSNSYIVPRGSSPVLSSTFEAWRQFPYYYQGATYADWNGFSFYARSIYTGPAQRAGEQLVAWGSGSNKQPSLVWQYLNGQHRLRKAPDIEYDGVYPDCGGYAASDEVEVFNGFTDRYDWKLVGKKEMYIPYNNNKVYNATAASLFQPNFLNPDLVRWELHRVWVVEGRVAPGKRNVIGRRTLYIDEDTWQPMVADEYNSSDTLVKENIGYEVGLTNLPSAWSDPNTVYRTNGSGYCQLSQPLGGDGSFQAGSQPRKSSSFFDPNTIAAEAAR